MIGYIILIPLQFVAAFIGAPIALPFIDLGGDARIFVHAALYAVIVWLVGLLGSVVLKGVRTPSIGTLLMALVGAMIGAALIFVPAVLDAIPVKFPPLYLPLAGAILGYLLKRG
jgi:hypothetical protein